MTLPPGIPAGLAAGTLSLLALALRGRLETGSAVRPLNAPSHWLWGDRALRETAWSLRYTGVGFAIHQLSAVLWGCIHARRERPSAPLAEAAVTTAVAVVTDLALTPRRLTPGFERHLSPRGLVWVYGAFALGLALAARRSRRP